MSLDQPINILLVDDRPENLLVLRAVLSSPSYHLVEASSGLEALEQLKNQDFAVILLDVQMPGMDGFETARRLRAMPRSQATPIIFVTAIHRTETHARLGYELGAVDYLFKPFDTDILKAKVAVFADLFRKSQQLHLRDLQLAAQSQAEAVLKASERYFRQIAEVIPQIVYIADASGKTEYYNHRWYEYTGLPHGSSDDDAWSTSVHPDDLDRINAIWDKARQNNQPFEAEYRLRKADGTYRWHLGRSEAVCDTSHEGSDAVHKRFGTATDIDDQKRMLVELHEERVHRERFVAMLTHDLRNPLSAVRLGVESLSLRAHDPEKVAKFSTRVLYSLDRADQMIANLLDANRIKAGEPLPLEVQELGLKTVVSRTLEGLSAVHGPRFKLEAEAADVRGYWSREGLERIIENLATNAVKYGDPQAPITVRIQDRQNQVSVSVHNQGPALSSTELEQLFKPFHRTQSAQIGGQQGWGLGLTLVRGLAEAHGGCASVESDADLGTQFTIGLPKDARPFQLAN
jgi:PAS domain S-box-containing protein